MVDAFEVELERIARDLARDLKRQRACAGTPWSAEHLMNWLRDNCQCVYCGLNLVASADTHHGRQHTEHLLPVGKGQYPWLKNAPSMNLLPPCSRCNTLKGGWEPNTQGGEVVYEKDVHGPVLSASQQKEPIARAKAHIEIRRQRQEKRFALFQQAITAAQQAVNAAMPLAQ